MKKHIFAALAVLALSTPGIYGRQLSVAEALEAAGAATTAAYAPGHAPEAAFTATSAGLNTVYAVNTADGFMLLAADDVCTTPVLGISDAGHFDATDIPAALADMIAEYSAQIARAAQTGGTVLSAPADPSLTSIAPITRTRWNQDAPYNDLAPRVNGQETYTGCVATAVAQVMKVYNYPTRGVGSHSYTWNNQTLSFDFANTTFEWDKMLDTYRNNPAATAENKAAVATLMYGIGISCQMNFGTGGSGASGINAAIGLAAFMNYDHSLQYLSRDFYGLPEWCRMLHGELAQGHPVYYDGANATVGHAFVIDGYRASDGLFHVNWGWGGVSDGYYAITTLDPENQGIGGSMEGYAQGQSAIFGLKPMAGGPVMPNICSYGNFIETGTFGRNSDVEIYLGGVFSLSISTVNVNIGLKVTPATGDAQYLLFGEAELDPYYGYNGTSTNFKDVPEGVYTITPVYLFDGEEYPVNVPVGTPKAVTVTVGASNVEVTSDVAPSVLTVTDRQVMSPLYRSKPAVIDAVISNSGAEYYGTVSARIVSGSTETKIAEVLVDILDGESQEVTFIGRLPFGVRKGDATISFYDADGNLIGEPMTVNIIGNAPTGDPAVRIEDIEFAGTTGGNGTQADPYIVDPDNFRVTATLVGVSGYFSDAVSLYVVRPPQDIAAVLTAPLRPVAADMTAALSFDGMLGASLEPGTVYCLYFANNEVESHWPDGTYFMTSANSGAEAAVTATEATVTPNPVDGVCTLSAPAAIAHVEVINLTGATVLGCDGNGENTMTLDASSLAAGHYFVRLTLADGTAPVVRMIKK